MCELKDSAMGTRLSAFRIIWDRFSRIPLLDLRSSFHNSTLGTLIWGFIAAINWKFIGETHPIRNLVDRGPDSMFVGRPNHRTPFAGFCRETLVKLGNRKYVWCCFTIAYTRKTFEISDAVERLDRTRSSITSKIQPVGRIFRIGHSAPVAQWIE